jgi:flagella basal body P-ring formation protein FlgA
MNFLFALFVIAASLSAECLPIHGDRIRAEDLAPVIAEFGAARGRTLAPAPLAGAERRFPAAELRRLARRLGLTVSQTTNWPESVCFGYLSRPLTLEAVDRAIRRSTGPGASFEVVEFTLFPVPLGDIVFKNISLRPDRRDGTRLLHGSVEYAPARRVPVWARLRALEKPKGLVAAQDLRAGVTIEASQVRLADLDYAIGPLLTAPEDIRGLTPRHAIAAGTPLTPRMLIRSRDVDPGQTVQVRVRAGAARLSFESRAETGGYTGDQILLKNPVSGQRFKAKVEGQARASVNVTAKED